MQADPTVRTARTTLTRPVAGDLDELATLHADARVWEHLPSGRHTGPEATARLLLAVQRSWESAGLGSWVVRDAGSGELLGLGGCDLRVAGGLRWWNLGYRLHRAVWGRGLAQEVITEARAEAGRRAPDLAVVAFLLEHNEGSRRAAERAGLRLVGRGPDRGNPDPQAVRLVFADREVDEDLLSAVLGA
ncbi:GNAT family N-acetyltransferase [Kineococcus gynurae]|uniref:GNAT family N-acetyltransferase n=1 Tax=Kineococcus gynurae TaxID=452979 RepID=A0ABV5LP31_9ACTN